MKKVIILVALCLLLCSCAKVDKPIETDKPVEIDGPRKSLDVEMIEGIYEGDDKEEISTSDAIVTEDGISIPLYNLKELRDEIDTNLPNWDAFIKLLNNYKYQDGSPRDASPISIIKYGKGNCSGISSLIYEYIKYKTDLKGEIYLKPIDNDKHHIIVIIEPENSQKLVIDLTTNLEEGVEKLCTLIQH